MLQKISKWIGFPTFCPSSTSAVHVWIREFSHEWIGANHLLHPHSNGELGVAIAKLVHVDCNDIGVVVELNEALESLAFEPFLNLTNCFFVHLIDGILDGALVSDGTAENSQGIVADVLRKVRLNLLKLTLDSGVGCILKGTAVAGSPGS